MNWPQATPAAEQDLADAVEESVRARPGKPADCRHHPDDLHVLGVMCDNSDGHITWGSMECGFCGAVVRFRVTSEAEPVVQL